MRRIVVGFDGSEPARRALDEAAKQAELNGVPLEVIVAWSFPIRSTPYPISVDPHPFEHDAQRVLDEGVERVRSNHPAVEVFATLVQDDPRNALVAATSADDWLVIGTRGGGGVAGLLLGSTAARCVRAAPCPVLVVPIAEG